MATAPLLVKYRTELGNYYVYDPATNEIVRVGEGIYGLLDDFHVLDRDEILEKHRSLGESNVREALARLEQLQSGGVLCDHSPQISSRAERVFCRGKEQPFEALLRDRRKVLVLELTHRCNLRCEYCLYGEHYPSFRNHDDVTMSLDVAKKAIEDFVDHGPRRCSIGFFGGEPLLEFELLKQIVLFAEERSSQCGIERLFYLTTNGTLLSDEAIHFLTEHEFSVLISLDGPKETHDQYRVFRDERHPEQRRGSYDVVMKNMERFVELYPDYRARGVSLTLTATSDRDQINELLKRLRPSFPMVSPSIVRSVADGSQGQREDRSLQMGCWPTLPCESGVCGGGACSIEEGDDAAEVCGDPSANHKAAQNARRAPGFREWTEARRNLDRSSRARLIRELHQVSDADAIRNTFPLSCALFRREKFFLHSRAIFRGASRPTFAYKCYPGATRTFCSTDGVLYPCERTETGVLFQLGDARNGVDVGRAIRLAEMARHLSDCGNCIAKKLCSLCPAVISELKDAGIADSLAFQKTCQRIVASLPARLKEYTTAMEMNREIVDELLRREEKTDDWNNDVRFVLTEEQQKEAELGVEELEPMT